MKKIFFLAIYIFSISVFAQVKMWEGPSCDFSKGKLKISENKRYLIFEDGTPFFYLGDTGWELFHRLTKDETEMYLENRRQKGFTVIQAVALAEIDGLNTPNREGQKALIDNDPLKPNEEYWKHIDWVIKKAEEKGIFIGLLPTWGDKVHLLWGVGPIIFNPDNAYKYGQWIGNRYKEYKNIIWINGGDRPCGDSNLVIWNAIAKGIKSVDKNHLMTFHPKGETSSSLCFHNESWLDFNMAQTGHRQRSYGIYKKIIKSDYQLKPTKPCFDGEPRYEDHPVAWKPDILGWYDDTDVRQAAYWSLFSGSFGHTYGCHPIWQMYGINDKSVGLARHKWNEVLDLPGATQMLYVRRLIESRPMLSRVPDSTLVKNGYMIESEYIISTKGDGYAFIFLPLGNNVKINLTELGFKEVKAWWFDPRTGDSKEINTIPAKGIITYTAPSNKRGFDWILVLDDISKNYPAPGSVVFTKY